MTPTTTHAHPPRLSSPIQLTALPPRPSGYPLEVTSTVHTSITPSPQDPESCIPSHQIRTQKKLPHIPRLPTCNLLNRKLARLSFQAMVAFGVLTTVYQAISLVPAFQSARVAAHALGMQGDVARDGRQAMTYGFLQECGNRKTQSLPLGKDCVKYLTKTPKAPPDIDDWMEDAEGPVSNLTTTTTTTTTTASIKTRDLSLASEKATVPSATTEVPYVWIYIGLCIAPGAGICIAIIAWTRSCHALSSHEASSQLLRIRLHKRDTYLYIQRASCILYMLWIWYLFFRDTIQPELRWRAAADFLDQCRYLQVCLFVHWLQNNVMHFIAAAHETYRLLYEQENNEVLGEDCAKYSSKKLKAQPEPTSIWMYWGPFIGFSIVIFGSAAVDAIKSLLSFASRFRERLRGRTGVPTIRQGLASLRNHFQDLRGFYVTDESLLELPSMGESDRGSVRTAGDASDGLSIVDHQLLSSFLGHLVPNRQPTDAYYGV